MLKDFDKAFTNKVKTWFSNTQYASSEIAYNIAFNLATNEQEKLTFPLINIYRPAGFEINDNRNFAANKRGLSYYVDEANTIIGNARIIDITLHYQLDIYAKSPESLDDITQDIIMGFNFEPKLTVIQHNSVDNIDYIESYDITKNNGPSEQSEFMNADRIYHYTIVYSIKNARLINFRKTKAVQTAIVETDIDGDEI